MRHFETTLTMIAQGIDTFTCSVCRKLYTDPVVHRACGLSFDRQCIINRCPARHCNQRITNEDLIVNYDLLKIVDEYRLRLETPCAYYLILLDTSTSMRDSDAWLPFAFGESRLTCALKFITDFCQEMNSINDKISLVTFDTATLQRFDFTTVDESHLAILKNLKFDGKDTALFDSIDFCLEKFQKSDMIPKNAKTSLYLLIVTDGGNNFGKKESIHARGVELRSGQLQVSGHMIQIGDRNRKKARVICDAIKYQFNHFNGGNTRDFISSFTNSIKTESRARASKAQDRASEALNRARVERNRPTQTTEDEPPVDLSIQMLGNLPEVPNTPLKMASKEKTLA